MENDGQPSGKRAKAELKQARRPNGNGIWLLLAALAAASLLLFWDRQPPHEPITYSFLWEQLENNNIENFRFSGASGTGKFKIAPQEPAAASAQSSTAKGDLSAQPRAMLEHFVVDLPPSDAVIQRLDEALRAKNVLTEAAPADQTASLMFLLAMLLPLVVLAALWFSYRRTREQLMGGGFLTGFAKSPAKRYEASDQQVTFKDVAGLEGVKADLQEIVDYLKAPEKFQKLGGRVPKGVLLNGSPGTGKTLLARAIAGEANVPFFSVNGSEFIQMFVGVGASRVRDLFRTAKEQSPAIIFIDEIDAVGRQRGAGLGGGHDEREQTLNQILGEMDGFSPNDSVIVIAATNRPDVLDPALLRPGRFDRHITVGRPTLKGRVEIFKVHVRDVPLADDVDLERLAKRTVGLTGADIRNIVNEAALWAARQDKKKVEMADFEHAQDKILMGAKREEVLKDEEKRKTAYHEIGHTLAAWYLPGTDPVHKVTIIPRGRALGVTHMAPTEDRVSMAEHELRDRLVVAMAGRAAEKLIYGETTIGAENDLERATGLARRMVTHWGMSPRLGPVSYKTSEDDPFLGREIHQQRQFSEHTQELIDSEVAGTLREAALRAEQLLVEKRMELEKLTTALLQQEELSEDQIRSLIGPSVHGDSRETAVKVAPPTPETVVESPGAPVSS
jgi:cell division protease FtsH